MRNTLFLALLLIIPLIGIGQTSIAIFEKSLIVESIEDMGKVAKEDFLDIYTTVSIDWVEERVYINSSAFNIESYVSEFNDGFKKYNVSIRNNSTIKFFILAIRDDLAIMSDVNGRTLILLKD